MRKNFFLSFAVLIPFLAFSFSLAFAQPQWTPRQEQAVKEMISDFITNGNSFDSFDPTANYTLTGEVSFQGGVLLPGAYTIGGTLPAANFPNRVAIVTNGNAAGDCTTGGGSTVVWCRDTGATWVALGDGNSAGTPGFDVITTGTNTTATMTMGTGGSLVLTGNGVVESNKVPFRIDFVANDTETANCTGTARFIFYDASEGIFKKCQEGVLSNLAPASTGDVAGPATATDECFARFDTTTGKLLQNSGVCANDTNDVTGVNSLTLTGAGAAKVTFPGTTSGSAAFVARAVQGTPNDISPPAATGEANQVLITDGGNPQLTSWAYDSGAVIDYDSTRTSISNSAAKTTLYTFTLAGNRLPANGCLEVNYLGEVQVNGGGSLTLYFSFGGTEISDVIGPTISSTEPFQGVLKACNRGATNSQFLSFTVESINQHWRKSGTATVTTASNVTVTVSGQFSVASSSNNVHQDIAMSKVFYKP